MARLRLDAVILLVLLSCAGIILTGQATADDKAVSFGTSQVAPSKPHHISAEVCKNCHGKIYTQWKGSMHGQSSALNDPIHGGFYRFVMGSPHKEGLRSKKGKYPVCLNCHAPTAALDKKTDLTAKVAS